MELTLIFPAFIAGLLTFFAPCTLPLVPGFLAFIGGTSLKDISDGKEQKKARQQIVKNAIYYVLGFSAIFIVLGTFFGIAGIALAQYREVLTKIGAVLIIFFGLYLMHIFDLKFLDFLNQEKKLNFIKKLKPGTPQSSFLLGATFAAGWTPCVGPILGSILVLASVTSTFFGGAILLAVFSFGLAIPFLLLAVFIGKATDYVKIINKYLSKISFVGGLFLLAIGIMMLTGTMAYFNVYIYDMFNFIGYDRLLDHL